MTTTQRIPDLFKKGDFVDLESGKDLLDSIIYERVNKSFTSLPKNNQHRENHLSRVLVVGMGMVATVVCNQPAVAKPKISSVQSCKAHDYLADIADPLGDYLTEISSLHRDGDDDINAQRLEQERQAIIDEISSFESIEDDWDGDGAIPLSEESAMYAKDFVRRLNHISLTSLSYISLNANSTIAFIWDNEEGKKISLNIGSQSFSYYVDMSSEDRPKFFNDVKVSAESIAQLDAFISWL